jgi:hypothetical protein
MPAHPLIPLSFLICSHLCFCSVCFERGGANTPMSQTESTRTWEVENVAVQASVREDVEGELVEARQG